MVYSINLKKWNSSNGRVFTQERVYKNGYKWTPLVKVSFRHSLGVLLPSEYDVLNPPGLIHKYIDGRLFIEHIQDEKWLNVGYIPTPKTRLGWFVYHIVHGLVMRYPVAKVLGYALANTAPNSNYTMTPAAGETSAENSGAGE